MGAEAINGQFVIAVELEIDPAQLEQFKAAIKENGETAVKAEPGCLAFNAVFERDNPTHIRLFEIYASSDAFKSHLETPHFKNMQMRRRTWSSHASASRTSRLLSM
jgi:quinol monooxygenase YgiN